MVRNLSGLMSQLGTAQTMRRAGGIGTLFDYKTTQSKTQTAVERFNQGRDKVNTLKKETADFLTAYTAGMKAQQSAADKLVGGALDKRLYDYSGNITDKTVKATVNATQDLIDAHNANLKLLNDNAERGFGAANQIRQMVDDPAPKAAMEKLGIEMNKDGTLALNKETLTDALQTTSPDQLRLTKDLLAGPYGLASHLKRDAGAGLRLPAADLIEKDIAEMKQIQEDTSLWGSLGGSQDLHLYSRNNVYALNNLAATGMLMNLFI